MDARLADLQAPRDLGKRDATRRQPMDFGRLGPRGRLAALVLAFSLRLRDAFALPLQHGLALEFGHAAEDREHELMRRWRARTPACSRHRLEAAEAPPSAAFCDASFLG